MAKVLNGIETFPKISTGWKVPHDPHERYRRQTDRRRETDLRQHIANVNVSSRLLEMAAKLPIYLHYLPICL